MFRLFSYFSFMENNISPQSSQGLTLDKIIEKFIPVIGAVFMTIGLGYLLYTSVWIHLDLHVRLWLWFFLSLAIIGGSYSFSEKLRYFADIGIGAGILLLYGTLIYGSRTTGAAEAAIPEVATLITAFIFTIAIAYFASARKSQIILVLGMIGSYMTPFVIGQNDVWVQNISFNAYLTYFAAINIVVFLLGREIEVRKMIPLNIIGLFLGTSTLYHLSYAEGIGKVSTDNFFTSELFSAILFLVLVVFSLWSILLSAKQFEEKDEWYLALGYLAPVLWFIWNLASLTQIMNPTRGALYAILAASCFYGWHVLRAMHTRFQHTALYASGILSAILAFFAFIPELSFYSSLAIAYSSLVFGALFVLDPTKWERLVSYGLLSLMGALLAIIHIENDISFQSFFVTIALVPAMWAYFLARRGKSQNAIELTKFYSFAAFAIALVYLFQDFLEYVNISFLIFFIVPFCVLSYLRCSPKQSHEVGSGILRATLVWFAFGFVTTFLSLVGSVYPAPPDTFILTHANNPTDWVLMKGIFATLILFLGLSVSRKLQTKQEGKRPSFLLVIFWYATLLLTVNYIILALMNDMEVPMGQGGPRAIATTLWWIAIALYMLIVGIRKWARYHSEKLLGLLLLALTVGKILLYDLETMAMQNKIIVLMVVGGALMLFSYGVHTKGWLQWDKKENQ